MLPRLSTTVEAIGASVMTRAGAMIEAIVDADSWCQAYPE
jgi:hypothetical protein